MNKPLRYMLFVSLALFLAACSAPEPEPTLPPPTAPPPAAPPAEEAIMPADVLTAMTERFNAGDLDGGMAYWADDAIWYILGLPPTGSELLVGKDAIRAEFERELADHLVWQVAVETVVGNVVTSHDTTWLDFTRQLGVAPVGATGQYLIENGRIATYAWTVDADSLVKLKAALAEMAPAEADAAADSTVDSTVADAPASAVTVIVEGGTCRLDPPVVLQRGPVTVTLDVRDSNRDAYAVVLMSLDNRYDAADLMASTTGTPPVWAHLLHYEEVAPATSATWTIEADASPLYGICFSRPPDHPIGLVGPLVVAP